MILFGNWEGTSLPHRPTVLAYFTHSCINKEKQCTPIRFLIDTGADRTFIVPEHQALLEIPPEHINFEVKPVDTLAGQYPFKYLRDCALTFVGDNGVVKTVKDLTIYFAANSKKGLFNIFKKNDKPLSASGVYPSILGRDVLKELCMGYSNEKDYLFLSQRNDDYYKCLSTNFLKPPPPPPPVQPPIPPSKPPPKWLGTDYDIAEAETSFP